jgi:23S rRNA pseudouridine2457 synthase
MFQTLAFHKPFGVVSQFSDRGLTGRSTLADFLDCPGLYPVGRLDRDSEGLLLLTNDGRLSHRLTDPRHEHPKRYWVQVENEPNAQALEQLKSGVLLRDGQTRPALARRMEAPADLPDRSPPIRYRKTVPTAWIEIVLREGRNRQVRRMTAAVGHPTLRLIRVAVGPIELEDLAPGKFRSVRPGEVRALDILGASGSKRATQFMP